ncbi:unnamed protein product [Schistosoma curassoni]|uniref:Secreted protein n=1 Tax=Schistosoma curassoni TaxID=6186 RepID=A0A183JFN5_9TREM|nr:unnamed protein product [Schistosoma curassoni]
MVVGGSRQGTLDLGFVLLGTRQQGVPVILRELVHLADGCQVARNPSPEFPVDFLQPPSNMIMLFNL